MLNILNTTHATPARFAGHHTAAVNRNMSQFKAAQEKLDGAAQDLVELRRHLIPVSRDSLRANIPFQLELHAMGEQLIRVGREYSKVAQALANRDLL